MLRFVWIAAVVCAGVCHAAQSPWDGTWTMNPDKSTIKPAPFSLEKSGARYTLHYDGVYTFACDGKEYSSPTRTEVRCHESHGSMHLVVSRAHRSMWRGTFSPGPQPNTMIASVSRTMGGGKTVIETASYRRAGEAGTSLAGDWKPVKMRFDVPDRAILRVHDGFLYYMDTLDGNVADAKLDGTPAPWLDPHPKNQQWSNRMVSPRKIVGHALVDGKPVNTETLELSPDGKSIKIWLGEDESAGYAIFEKSA